MQMTTVAIHQPNYIPWLGYFKKIAQSDYFVFFDNVQMPGGKSYVYRTAINIQGKHHWLSVPISNKGAFLPINETKITDYSWIRKHIKTLDLNYAYSPWRGLIKEKIAPILDKKHRLLVDLNIELIEVLMDIVGIKHTTLIRASSMELESKRADSIEEILLKLQADTYLTGQGKGTDRYLNMDKMKDRGIDVHFVTNTIIEYPQLRGKFIAGLSIIDAILNCGPEEVHSILLEDI
jgi:hypothetical protein